MIVRKLSLNYCCVLKQPCQDVLRFSNDMICFGTVSFVPAFERLKMIREEFVKDTAERSRH